MDQFPVGSKLINELMSKLMEEVKQQPAVLKEKLYQAGSQTQLMSPAGPPAHWIDYAYKTSCGQDHQVRIPDHIISLRACVHCASFPVGSLTLRR